jgi:hypothetical protein
MRTSTVFRSEGSRGDFEEAYHRDLSKPRAEVIEPAFYIDCCDRKITGRRIVNPFYPDVPRGYVRPRESLSAPHPPGSLSVAGYSPA